MSRSHTSRALLLGAVCLLSVSACGTDQSTTLQLRPYFRALRFVEVIANESDTLRLIMDTGGGQTVLTPGAASRLGCTPRGALIGRRMSGEEVRFAQCPGVTLAADSWRSSLESYGVFDLSAVLPKELPPVDGVLALDAFRNRVVVFDWRGNTLGIAEGGAADRLAARALPARVATGDGGGMVSVLLRNDSDSGVSWWLLDSGNLVGTIASASTVRDSLIEVGPDSTTALRFGRTTWRSRVTVKPLVIDGALGTDFLISDTVVVDLRFVRASRAWPWS